MRHRRKMQPGIGRTARTGHNPCRVLEALTGDNVTGADVFLEQRHDGLTRGNRILIAALVRCRCTRGIHERKANGLGHAGHRVGSKLAATGPG